MTHGEQIVIGILGGIGAGKTTVSRIFHELGAEVIAADSLVHDFLRRGVVRRAIEKALDVVLPKDEASLRRQLAERVFANPDERRRLEGILHPLVDAEIRRRLEQTGVDRPSVGGTSVIVLDVPLLLEAGMQNYCDRIVFVAAPEEVRFARIAEGRNWSPGEARARERSQLPLERKKAASTWTVNNGTSLEETRAQILKIWRALFPDEQQRM